MSEIINDKWINIDEAATYLIQIEREWNYGF